MDALGLVTLQGTIVANPGSNTADGSTLDARSDSPSLDFAQLLAAGLMPQPSASGMASPPPAAAEGAEATPSTTAPAASNDAAAQMNAVAAALLLPGTAERSAQAEAITAATLRVKDGPASKLSAADGKAEPASANAAASVAAPAAVFADAASAATKAAGAPAVPGAPGDSPAIAEIAVPAAHTPRLSAAAHDVHAHEQLSAASEAPALPAHALSQPAQEPIAGARPTAVLDVPAAVDTPEFAPALAQQVVWMADKDAQVAELRIDPPELGPVEVRLQLNGDEAAVQFVSAHAEVRSALEGAIARLRESLAQAGIQLGEASVGAESFRDSEHPTAGRDERGFARGRDGEHGWSDSLPAPRVQRGLVDLFA